MTTSGITGELAAVKKLLLAWCLKEEDGFTGTWVTLIIESCPEIAVLSLSPSSIQREVSFPRAACNPVCP